jgi:hypothetical protein
LLRILKSQGLRAIDPKSSQCRHVRVWGRLAPLIVLHGEGKLEMAQQIAVGVDELEVCSSGSRDYRHAVLPGERRKHTPHAWNLDRFRPKEALLGSVTPQAKLSDAVISSASLLSQVPARYTGSHELKIGLLRKVHANSAEYQLGRFEVPSVSIDQHTVVIPKQEHHPHVSSPER